MMEEIIRFLGTNILLQGNPDVEITLGWLGVLSVVVAAIIAGGFSLLTARITRTSVRTRTAQATAEEAQGTAGKAQTASDQNAARLDEYENRFQEQFDLIQELRDEVLGLRQEVLEWRRWGAAVIAVIKARQDGAHIESELPPMPRVAGVRGAAQARRGHTNRGGGGEEG